MIRPASSLSLACIAILLAFSPACEGGDKASTPPSDATEAGTSPPALVGTTRDGAALDLKELAGKVVIVDFWASWCVPCKDELPELEALYEKHADEGLVVIGVSVDESTDDMNAFLETMPLSFPIVFDEGKAIVERWNPPKMPTSYFIGRDGQIAHVQAGFEAEHAAEFATRVREMLDQ